MNMIELKNIGKKYGNTVIIENLNLDIVDKEFLVLLGPSGCGKTTLMRMIAGLEEITAGQLLIEGRVVNHLSPKSRKVSMVFQNYSLYPHMSVADNIGYPLLVEGQKKQERLQKVDEVSQIVELNHLLERQPSELSGGQRQRVALARAIIKEENQIFLMDEPLSNLDALLRHSMRAQIKNLHHRLQKTIIYVTHDQVEAMTMASRIVILKYGQIQQIGTPQEIYAKPANIFVASFIGSPPMNIIKGRVSNQKFSLASTSFSLNRDDLPQEVYLGFRPEHLSLSSDRQDGQIKGRIYAIEFLGEASLITIKINDQTNIVAKLNQSELDAHADLHIDAEIALNCPSHNLYFFDIKTEQLL